LIGFLASTSFASSSDSSCEGRSAYTLEALKYKLSKVQELRLDVDRLRSIVTDRIAEDMGRRLTCTPQWIRTAFFL